MCRSACEHVILHSRCREVIRSQTFSLLRPARLVTHQGTEITVTCWECNVSGIIETDKERKQGNRSNLGQKKAVGEEEAVK